MDNPNFKNNNLIHLVLDKNFVVYDINVRSFFFNNNVVV